LMGRERNHCRKTKSRKKNESAGGLRFQNAGTPERGVVDRRDWEGGARGKNEPGRGDDSM